MALGMMTSVIDAIARGPEGGQYASLTIAGLDPRDPSKIYSVPGGDFEERALQYWPETITDSIEIGWNFKDIPGGSNALAQWSSNNGRTITFDVQLSRMMAPIQRSTNPYKLSLKEKTYGAQMMDPNTGFGVDQKPYNVNIVEYVKFLRGMCYPSYYDVEGIVSALPPPIVVLNIPNMQLNEDGSDSIYCVMTGCDVTYNLAFIDGTPRRATVSCTFRQVVQNTKSIKMVGFGPNAPMKYNIDEAYNREGLNRSAGRPINGSGFNIP